MSPGLDITLLATADWDHPFWTNKQHVAVSLAALGHRVLYVDSLGLRPPTLGQRDRGRLWRRLRLAFPRPRPVRPGIWVISPLQLPLRGRRVPPGRAGAVRCTRVQQRARISWRVAPRRTGRRVARPTRIWTSSTMQQWQFAVVECSEDAEHCRRWRRHQQLGELRKLVARARGA